MLNDKLPSGSGYRPPPVTAQVSASSTSSSANGTAQQAEAEATPHAQALRGLQAAVLETMQASDQPFTPEEAQSLAEELLNARQGGTLDLSRVTDMLDGPDAEPGTPAGGETGVTTIGLLTPQAWQALDAGLRALGGPPVRHAVLPAEMTTPELALVARTGLSQLPDLREVTVKVPRGAARVDLRPLTVLASASKPLAVVIDAPGDTLQEVLSAATLRERARHERGDIHARKCVVAYPADADGKACKPRPLSSYFYRRGASGMEDAARAAGLDMKTFASTRQLNGKAFFMAARPDGKSASASPAVGAAIVCRHLCMAWLLLRAQVRAGKGTAQAQRFSYASFASKEAIASQVSPSTDTDFDRLITMAPAAVVLADDFGQALAMQLEGMAVGESRLFGLLTADHAMTADLQRLQRDHGGEQRDEFIVDVYDPNDTAEHVRASLGSLEEVRDTTLWDWLATGSRRRYFVAGTPAILSMHLYATVKGSQVTRPASAPAQRAFLVPQALATEPTYLYWSLLAGDAERVRASLAAMLARTQDTAPALAERLGGAQGNGLSNGLHAAMYRDNAQAVRAYVAGVLAVPAERLPSGARQGLLRGAREGEPAVTQAALTGQLGVAQAWLQAILSSALPGGERVLLALALNSRESPLVQRICAQPLTGDERAQAHREQFIYLHVREALAAPSLTALERKTLLAAEAPASSSAKGRTAAQRALACRNPGAAGALVCAVLEAGLEAQQRDEALAAMGVTVDEVLQALETGPGPGENWAGRITAARGSGDSTARAQADAPPVKGVS